MLDFLYTTFPVSGVTTYIFVPAFTAFFISFFTSMGGVSGAFMLLPFQISILNYTAPSVSGTNQLYNVVAIPSGVWRYIKEKRMVWPLAWAVIIGTMPGVFIGAWIRLAYLPDARNFKFFAGLVLLYIGIKLLQDIIKKSGSNKKKPDITGEFIVTDTSLSLKRVKFKFNGENFSFPVFGILILCFIVGILGGIYGIGGGAIVAPFFVTFFKLPVYIVAGAALMGTFATSIAGVAIYQILSAFYTNLNVAPDWLLGISFGIGGFFGMYLGARCQKYFPSYVIKLILCVSMLFISVKYVLGFLL
jgi:uncharacterized membrane protein YfcA